MQDPAASTGAAAGLVSAKTRRWTWFKSYGLSDRFS